MKKQKGLGIEILVTGLLLLFALVVVFFFRGDLPNKKQTKDNTLKNVEVIVINENEDYNKTHSYKTDEKTLGDLLANKNVIEYSDGEYGKFITAADGMKADDSKEQWWNVEVNNESATTGIDEIPIKDGDEYTLTMKTGY